MHNQPPHTSTVNHIVGRLLQLWRADSPLTLSQAPVDVMVDLQFDQEDTESRLIRVKNQATVGIDTAVLQRKRDLINEYLDIGRRLTATLTDAIEARRQEKDTGAFTIELYVEERDTYQHQDGYFTTKCVYDWASEEFGIEIPEWAPAQVSTKANMAKGESPAVTTPRYTDLDKEKQEIIIALLLEELATSLKGKFVENGLPNYTQLGERIAAKCAKEKVDINGMSKEKLRKKFSDAMKTKARYQPDGK